MVNAGKKLISEYLEHNEQWLLLEDTGLVEISGSLEVVLDYLTDHRSECDDETMTLVEKLSNINELVIAAWCSRPAKQASLVTYQEVQDTHPARKGKAAQLPKNRKLGRRSGCK
jgi:hypothetical protein